MINKNFLIIGVLFLIPLIISQTVVHTDIQKICDGKIIGTYPFGIGTADEKVPVTFWDCPSGNGVLIYKHNGEADRKYENIKNGSSFTFKDKKLVEAKVGVSKDSEYMFGNKKVKIPKDSKIIFKDSKVSIELPKDYKSVIEKPVKIPDSKDVDVKVEYKYAEGEKPSEIKIKDDFGKEIIIKRIGSDAFTLNYDGKLDSFYVTGNFETNGVRVGKYSNPRNNNDNTYIFFDGNEHKIDKNYVSIGDKKITLGAVKGENGPTIELLKGNPVLKNIEDKNFFMVQALGGKDGSVVVIENRDVDKKIPVITSSGGYNIFDGSKVVRYVDEGEYKDKTKGPRLLTSNPIGDANGKSSIALQVVTKTSSGSRLDEWDAVFDTNNNVRAGLNSKLESDLASVKGGQVTSIRNTFHELRPEEQEKLKNFDENKQRALSSLGIEQIREELKKIPDQQGGSTNIGSPLTPVPLPPIQGISPPPTTATPTTPTPVTTPTLTPIPTPTTVPTQPISKKWTDLTPDTKNSYVSALRESKALTSASSVPPQAEYTKLNIQGKDFTGYVFKGKFKVTSFQQSQLAFVTENKEVFVQEAYGSTSVGSQYRWKRLK